MEGRVLGKVSLFYIGWPGDISGIVTFQQRQIGGVNPGTPRDVFQAGRWTKAEPRGKEQHEAPG